MLKLAHGLGIGGLETAERFLDLGIGPRRNRSGRRRFVGRPPRSAPLHIRGRAGARLAQRPNSPRGRSNCLASHRSRIMSAMTSDNDPHQKPTIFSAVLTPHRSLSPTGFLIFMLVLGGVSFVSGI